MNSLGLITLPKTETNPGINSTPQAFARNEFPQLSQQNLLERFPLVGKTCENTSSKSPWDYTPITGSRPERLLTSFGVDYIKGDNIPEISRQEILRRFLREYGPHLGLRPRRLSRNGPNIIRALQNQNAMFCKMTADKTIIKKWPE